MLLAGMPRAHPCRAAHVSRAAAGAGRRRATPWSTGPVSTDPGPEAVLVVDGANVVGSRPDGWWRDRAGAAARLHGRLATASLPVDRVVLVLEGAARPGVPRGTLGALETVHAPGSGDDEVVAQVARATASGGRVTVVTSDRGLRARVVALGADVVGPGWLDEH